MQEAILKVNQLSKHFGAKRAVDAVSFHLDKSSILGIIGPNGSGKTTILNLITDLSKPTNGSYSWFEQASSYQSQRKKVGVLIEQPNFFPRLSGFDNLKIASIVKGIDSTNEIYRVLSKVGLEDAAKQSFKSYSLGMKQRLSIASALLGNPDVLILDEPTNGLDPMGIRLIREIIQEEHLKGVAVILCSHLLDEVGKICTDLVILKNGTSLFQGKMDELKQQAEPRLVILTNDVEKLKELLTTQYQSNTIKIENGKILLYDKGMIDIQTITTLCNVNGLVINGVYREEQTLEDTFIKLVQTKNA